MSLIFQNLRNPLLSFNPRTPLDMGMLPHPDLYRTLPHNVFNAIMATGVGIEVEVEQVKNIEPEGWVYVKEGSLRNNGGEWITLAGLRVEGALEALNSFRSAIDCYPNDFHFTERTSIHIHLDSSMFSSVQIGGLLLLYTLVETSLFNFAGPNRRHGVFSVPFRESILNYTTNPKSMIERWSKYSALNLKTLNEYGTVEFRIMEGNMNVERIFYWITLLGLLHDAARRMSIPQIKRVIQEISSDSYYREALRRIFFGFVDMLHWSEFDMDQATIDAKMLLEQMEV